VMPAPLCEPHGLLPAAGQAAISASAHRYRAAGSLERENGAGQAEASPEGGC
jgi:hypothetical protein